jgi:CubicO group peptidase (beta-lactamase class C family)
MMMGGARPQALSRESGIVRLDGTRLTASQADATVLRAMHQARVPGLGVVVLNHGSVTYANTFGDRDTADHKPFTPDTVITAASLTKPVFAVLVLQLVEQGTLDLDRPVVGYLTRPLPEYGRYQDLASDARYAQITLRMLLDHTSGLPNWRWLTDDRKLRIYFTPGSRFAYSGEGIALAQQVVEAVTGQSVEDLMRDRIFRPLGMTRTSMIWQPRFEDDYANGYDENGKSLGPQRRTKPNAAGGLQTTLHDYALFVQAVLKGKLLHEKSTAQMFSPQVRINSAHEFPTLAPDTTTANDSIRLSYGLGWGLYWSDRGKAFFKEGNDNGWRNYVVCFAAPQSGVLIMTNSSNGEDVYAPLLENLLRDTYTPYEWERFKRAGEARN